MVLGSLFSKLEDIARLAEKQKKIGRFSTKEDIFNDWKKNGIINTGDKFSDRLLNFYLFYKARKGVPVGYMTNAVDTIRLDEVDVNIYKWKYDRLNGCYYGMFACRLLV